MYELKELKQIRKKLGLTQAQLANQAGVSQSLVAKVESHRLDPTFSKAKKIFETLDNLSHKKQLKAHDIMVRKVFSVQPTDNIKVAIQKMKHHEISQLPVLDGNTAVGLISETSILQAMLDNKAYVREIMDESPPIVSLQAGISVVSQLLTFYPLVLVVEQGQISGVITKSDIIRNYKM